MSVHYMVYILMSVYYMVYTLMSIYYKVYTLMSVYLLLLLLSYINDEHGTFGVSLDVLSLN
jgi:hypothetical protein